MSDHCRLHDSYIRNDIGEFVCCKQEEWSAFPQTEPPREPHPPPDDVRARIAAAVGPGRTAERANVATPDDATTSTEGAGCG